jgi:hypothetical protein
MDLVYQITAGGEILVECTWVNGRPKLLQTSLKADVLGFALRFGKAVELYDPREGLIDVKRPKDPFQFFLWLLEWCQEKNRELNRGLNVVATGIVWSDYIRESPEGTVA